MVDVVCRQRRVASDLQMRLLGLGRGFGGGFVDACIICPRKSSRKEKARQSRAEQGKAEGRVRPSKEAPSRT